MNIEQADEMTLQEAIVYGVTKMVEQGRRCDSITGACHYGDASGNHCAVGWLLDETDSQLMDYEGSVVSLVGNYGQYVPDIVKGNQTAFGLVQLIHDSTNLHRISEARTSLAISHDVTISDVLFDSWVKVVKNPPPRLIPLVEL